MMKIEIQKGLIAPIANFLYGLTLVRKQSRMRRHLIAILNQKQDVYSEDKKNLLEEHARKDEEGKAVIKDGVYDIQDKVTFAKDLKELNDEVIIIEGEDNREMIRTIKVALKKFEEVEYEGSDSEIYDYLCDQFSVDELEGGEN